MCVSRMMVPISYDVSVILSSKIATEPTRIPPDYILKPTTVLNYGDTLLAGDSIAISYSVDSITINEYLVLSSDFYPGANIMYSFTTTANITVNKIMLDCNGKDTDSVTACTYSSISSRWRLL